MGIDVKKEIESVTEQIIKEYRPDKIILLGSVARGELDIASQGEGIEHARNNLREALELFFETASPEEINQRIHGEVYVTQLEVAIG